MMTAIKNVAAAALVVVMLASAVTGEPGCAPRGEHRDPCSPTPCVVPAISKTVSAR